MQGYNAIAVFNKVGRYFGIDPKDVVVYIDHDRENDPIYFADETKELQRGLVAYFVADLAIVREEVRGNIWLYFKNELDATTYLRFAAENI